MFDRVLQREAEEIAFARAEGRQRRGLPLDSGVERTIVERSLAMDQRGVRWARPGVMRKRFGEVHHPRSLKR